MRRPASSTLSLNAAGAVSPSEPSRYRTPPGIRVTTTDLKAADAGRLEPTSPWPCKAGTLVAFREVRVVEVREVLRCWCAGDGLRIAAERAGADRKTARRYVEAAQTGGLVREGGQAQLSDELIGAVVAAVRPARAAGHGVAWETLPAHEAQIRVWVQQDELQLTNVHGKLARRGVVVPYRTLHRFATERCGFGRRQPTVRVADGQPGVECQLEFARLGLIPDPGSAGAGWCTR